MKKRLTKGILRTLLPGFLLIAILFTSKVQTFSQPISQYLVGQNAWMPEWYGGNLGALWDDMKLAGFQTIRIGGNGAMGDNKDLTKVITLIDGVRAAGSEPIVQVPHDYSTQQVIDYINYINGTMKRGIKLWSCGNEPDNNKVGDAAFVGAYMRKIGSALKTVDPNAVVMGPETAWYNGDFNTALVGGYADVTAKDANGNYPIDIITWHMYNLNDLGGVEGSVNDMLGRLAPINANRPAGKKLSWGITEINTHYDMAQVTNPDQYTWSFHAGQLFAEIYDLGMRKSGFTICPWAMFEHGGDRQGTDLSLFDYDLKGRATYYHSLMLGQNMKQNYLTNTDNQADVKIISMGDATGVAVMIMNENKGTAFAYSLKLDMGTVNASALQIKVNAGINAQIQGTIGAYSTQMLVFCPNGTLLKKYTYTSGNCDARQGPTIEQITANCAPPCNNDPTINAVTDKTYDAGAGVQSISLSGISDGDNCTQGVTITATSNNTSVAAVSGINYTSCNTNGTLSINPLSKGTATITVTVTDGGKVDCAPISKSTSFVVNVNQVINLPAKVEAENFTIMQGIQTETTTDAGGGLNIGYTDPTDYLDYYVNVPANGSYTIDFRVASAVTTGAIELRNQTGTALATLAPGTTGGWQTWVTKTVTANLTAGKQTLRIYYTGAGLNINWFEVKSATPVLTSIAVTPFTSTIYVGQTQQFTAVGKDQNGNVMTITPLWTATGGSVSASGLFTGSAAGNYTVTATSNNISGNATINVTALVLTTITVSPATVSLNSGQTQQFTAVGKDQLGNTIAFTPVWSATGGTITSAGLYTATTAGAQTITATSGTKTGTASATVIVSYAVPGVIQAENYSSMLGIQTETTTDAGGGQNVGYIDNGDWMTYNISVAQAGTYSVNFRVAGWAATGRISIQNASNTTLTSANIPNGGAAAYQVWSTVAGENTFTLAAGTQSVRIYATGAPWNLNWFEIKSVSSPVLTSITVTPATATINVGQTQQYSAVGKDQNGAVMAINPTWTTTGGSISISGLYTGSTAGTFSVTAQATNSLGTVISSSPVNITVNPVGWSTVIEAESYTSMFGIQTEATTDVGGGLNVGYTDANDWLSYPAITIPAAGTYTIQYRVASLAGGGSIQIEKAGGTAVYGNMAVPSTGGWQTWTTIQQTVTLPAGSINLGIKIITGGFNLNWFKITQGTNLKSAQVTSEIASAASNNVIALYPNPIVDNLKIDLRGNSFDKLDVIDLTGRVHTSLVLNANQAIYNVDFSGFKKGIYIVRLTGNNINEIRKVVKN